MKAADAPPLAASRSTSGGARTFILDTVVVFIAQLLNKLRGLLLLPLLVRGLGTTVLFWAIVGFNLHLSLMKAVASTPDEADKAYGTTLFASVLIPGTICTVVALASWPSARELMLGRSDFVLFGLTMAAVCTQPVRNLNLNLYRVTGRLRIRSVVDVAGSFVELAAMVVVVTLGKGLDWVVSCMVVVGAALALVTTLHARSIVGIGSVDRPLLGKAIRYGLPLIPAALAMWVLDRSDRFLIGYYLDPTDVGIYSAHYTIGIMISLVHGPIQMALVPKVLELWSGDRETADLYIANAYKFLLVASVLFVALAPVLAEPLFLVIANEQVANKCALDVLLIASGTSLLGLANVEFSALYASGRTRAIGFFSALSAVVNVAANLLLIPRFGIVAAAFATAVAYIVLWLCGAAANKAWRRIVRSGGFFARCVGAAIPAAVVVRLWGPRGIVMLVVAALASVAIFGVLMTALLPTNDKAALFDRIRRRFWKRFQRLS